MKKLLLLCAILVQADLTYAGDTARVLFIGNSYTAYNNLAQLVKDVAASAGDVVITDVNAPGGTTLEMHSTNATTLSKIAQGNWDYVVLQEQSQLPSFPDAQVETDVYPYARKLDSLILDANPCAETIFYMTWGRKNGDASNCAFFPPVCTYSGMDSLIRLRYQIMADTNDAIVGPVGAVWRHLRNNALAIELFDADESHPSLAGSYAAACSFYTTIFAKDPTAITANAGVPAPNALFIRAAVKEVVFDSLLYWKIGAYTPPIGCDNSTAVENIKVEEQDITAQIGNDIATVWSKELLPAGTAITVTGMDGRIVSTQIVQTPVKKVELYLNNATTGLYLITVDGKKRISIKVMATE